MAISICFVLAVTLWFLVTLNTQFYESSFTVPLKVVNVPGDVQLTGDIPPNVRIKARGRGIDLISQKWESTDDTVAIDFSLFRGQEYFIGSNHLNVLSSAIKYDLRPRGMAPDSIPLIYVPKEFKKVPLVLDLELDMPLGYRHSGDLKAIGLDSVIVVGPKEELSAIDSWKTVRYKTPRFKNRRSFKVSLESRPPFQVTPKVVDVQVDPRLFTEISIKTPIRSVNVPTNLQVRFDPETVDVNLLVPLEYYDALKKGGVQAVVDFKQLDERSPLTIPEIRRVPPFAEVQRFSPVLVQYLIIEER